MNKLKKREKAIREAYKTYTREDEEVSMQDFCLHLMNEKGWTAPLAILTKRPRSGDSKKIVEIFDEQLAKLN